MRKEQDRGLLKSLNRESNIVSIEAFYHRIGVIVNSFQVRNFLEIQILWPTLNGGSQISALLNIQHMAIRNESARSQDADALDARFDALEHNHAELRRALGLYFHPHAPTMV